MTTLSTARDQRVEVGPGLRLRVRTLPGAGDPLLMLHGFTGGVEGWPEGALHDLLPHRTLLLVDLPGHGGSDPLDDPERWAADRVVEIVVRAQESLMGQTECDWLGYSMGGRIALHAACQGAPIRKLLLESTSPGLAGLQERERRVKADRAWVERLRHGPFPDFVEQWMSQPIFDTRNRLSDADLALQRRVRLKADPGSLAACLEGMGTGIMPPAWSRLSQLNIPVRTIVGAQDERYVALSSRMVACQPEIRRTVVPGVGHTVHLEAPEAWSAWVVTA